MEFYRPVKTDEPTPRYGLFLQFVDRPGGANALIEFVDGNTSKVEEIDLSNFCFVTYEEFRATHAATSGLYRETIDRNRGRGR